MFPEEIIKILQKYQNEIYQSTMTDINMDMKHMLKLLKDVQNCLSNRLYDIISSDSLNDDNSDERLFDIKVLKQQIAYMNEIVTSLPIKKDANIEVAEEINPTIDGFTDKICTYIADDDICPICNVKLTSHTIYYQEKEHNKILERTVKWYKCLSCNRLFALDYDISDFKNKNTNIVFSKKYYKKLLFNDAIVIFNINRCSSHNHKIQDLTCDLPIILPNGKVNQVSVPIIYCKTCNRHIMLKSVYDKLKGVPACMVIDETYSKTTFTENDFLYGDKGGSKLYKYGYNVNCTDKLTEEQRHTILTMQLLSNNITKGEICSILDTNISSGNKRKNSKKDWSKAVEKWEADKNFVQNIDLEKESQKINIDRIILKFCNGN